jgi:hypothetical protein
VSISDLTTSRPAIKSRVVRAHTFFWRTPGAPRVYISQATSLYDLRSMFIM